MAPEGRSTPGFLLVIGVAAILVSAVADLAPAYVVAAGYALLIVVLARMAIRCWRDLPAALKDSVHDTIRPRSR